MLGDLSPVPTVPLGGGRPHERADWTAERSQAINFNVSLLFFRIMYQLEMEVAIKRYGGAVHRQPRKRLRWSGRAFLELRRGVCPRGDGNVWAISSVIGEVLYLISESLVTAVTVDFTNMSHVLGAPPTSSFFWSGLSLRVASTCWYHGITFC